MRTLSHNNDTARGLTTGQAEDASGMIAVIERIHRRQVEQPYARNG